MAGGTTKDQSREAWAVSRGIAYPRALDGDGFGPKPDRPVIFDEDDVAQSREALRLQVKRAGLRLARLLEEALG